MIQIPYMVWRGKASPLVTTKLSVNDNSVTTLAYVDTGATYSVYNSDFCDRLGLNLQKGERVDIIVGDGGIIPVYLHEVKIKIEDLEFQAKIGFSDRLGTGINILGRETVLDEFTVCFDGKKKEIRWGK
jgi:predicted aspartyl protease